MLSLRHVSRSDPSLTIKKASRLVDDMTGIIRVIYENPCGPDNPPVFGYGSILADTTQFGVRSTEPLNGSTSLIRAQALAGAIGEAVERYSVRMVPEEQLVNASVGQLHRRQFVDPRSLVLYSRNQYDIPGFPYSEISDDLPINWVEGTSLTRGIAVLVPAFAVYIPYTARAGERLVVEQTTNGLACGNTLEEAILSGLLEVIERHAAQSMWLTRSSLPHIDCGTATDSLLRKTLAAFQRAPYDVHLLDATGAVGIPVAISVAIDRSGRGPAATLASAAGVSPQRAIVSALEELAQCHLWLKSLMSKRKSAADLDLHQLSTVEDHVYWATALERLELIEFVLASVDSQDVLLMPDLSSNDVLQDIDTCVSTLAERDYEVVVIDVTAPDIQEAGLHVVRVLVPGTQPLYFGKGLERISPRLAVNGSLNPWPHPFP